MSRDGNVLELQGEEINKKQNKSEPVGLCLNVSTNHYGKGVPAMFTS